MNILDKWQATTEQACRILRISRSTHARAKLRNADWSVSLDPDQMQRISFILNIHAALRLIFDNPENTYGFLECPITTSSSTAVHRWRSWRRAT